MNRYTGANKLKGGGALEHPKQPKNRFEIYQNSWKTSKNALVVSR